MSISNYKKLAPVKKKREVYATEEEKKSIYQIRAELDAKLAKTMEEFHAVKHLHSGSHKIAIKPLSQLSHAQSTSMMKYRSKEDYFDKDEFFRLLDKESIKRIEEQRDRKNRKRKIFKPGIDNILSMIMDITEESEKYLKEKKINLIDIPDWVNWMKSFIDGKFISSDEVSQGRFNTVSR